MTGPFNQEFVNKDLSCTVISSVEEKAADRGRLARTSGTSCMIVGYSDDGRKTRVRLPSGSRKTFMSTCRAMVGIVAGGGRMDKPVLKAGANFHKDKVKRNCWPKVRGCVMNPVEHPQWRRKSPACGPPDDVLMSGSTIPNSNASVDDINAVLCNLPSRSCQRFLCRVR